RRAPSPRRGGRSRRRPARCTLLPYTTLFRSLVSLYGSRAEGQRKGKKGEDGKLDMDSMKAHSAAALRARGAADKTHLFPPPLSRSEEHTSELQSRFDLVCRLLLETKNRSTTQ